ncbi:MAG: peptidylprolyl isomerase [Candidatus Poseidoniaceae archaeon]|nr:peptidylprolyl isomerase [Candidatus Poseidoniaceae archaeon]
MADDALSEAWEKAAKDITKGKNEGPLQTLRAADPQASDPMTARLVGEATWNIAKANDSKSDYRKAAMFLREASKKNPKDKKTSSLYNKLLNEMQEKRISETVIPRMFNNGGPTPAGMFAIFGGFLLVLGMITIANSESTTTDYVELNLSWTENGASKTGTVSIELYPNDAPAHAENFKQLVIQGKYDGTQFHRVIDDFMIQGGDFTNGDGTGGHAVIWDGYCNGQAMENSADCASTGWTLGDEADNGLLHEVCTISMAKTNSPHTGGSQFFLIPEDSTPSHLDGIHTVFGKVTSGCEHVTAISQVAVGGSQNSTPVNDVTIESTNFVGSEEVDSWYKFW